MTDESSGLVAPEPDGQEAAGDAPLPEPSLDDVVYIVAVRSAAPKDGHEIPPILDALVAAGVEPVTYPLAAAKAIRDSGSADHAALVRLGFEWHQANTIFTVVSESHA